MNAKLGTDQRAPSGLCMAIATYAAVMQSTDNRRNTAPALPSSHRPFGSGVGFSLVGEL